VVPSGRWYALHRPTAVSSHASSEPETPITPAPPSDSTLGAAPPRSRGVGLWSGVVTFAVAGVVDGISALVKSPPGSVPGALWPLVILQCVAILSALGVGLGALEELALASTRRIPTFVRLAEWAIGGPRRWFARDVVSASWTLSAMIALAVALGPILPTAYFTRVNFHSPVLSSLAVLLMSAASMGLGVGVGALLLAPSRALLARMGPLASPGAVLSLALALAGAQVARFVRMYWLVLRNLDGAAAALVITVVLAHGIALLWIGARVQRRGRAMDRRALLGVGLVPIALFIAAAFTFGARQTVASAIFNRSLVAGYVARALQLSLDFDRDGHSAVFGGGDCNDRDRAVHPGALDVPGNGLDENCSGADAAPDREPTDGRIVPLPPGATARPSIVLIAIDATRPDHLGVYGYRRPTSPHLDAFAAQGAVFSNAYCASPRSLRSFASIWTGRYPSLVAWGRDIEFPPLAPENVTLAELLRDGGYRTGAFSTARYFGETDGFVQGFERFLEADTYKGNPGPVLSQAADWLRERGDDPAPFFLWLHVMEPHDPYTDRSAPREFGHDPVDQYDEEIAYADTLLAPFYQQIAALEARRPVLTFVIGDHGEAFGEHGVYHHSFDLHDEALRVPLIVRGAGVAPGPRAALALLPDLHPTALNFAGRPAGAPLSSRSLVPVLFGDPASRANLTPAGWRDRVYGEVTPDGRFPYEIKSLYAPPFKIIHDLRRGTWELFDIARDRGELRNLYDLQPSVAATMRERLLSWIDGNALADNHTQRMIQSARMTAPPRPRHPLSVRFGDAFELLGYDFDPAPFAIGGAFRGTFYYRVLRRTRTPVWMSVTFRPSDGGESNPFFRASHYPVAGRYPTTDWHPGEILRDEVVMHANIAVRPTRYRFVFAAEYDGTGERLPTQPASPANELVLDEFEITR
jgi:choline-sulfatase